MGAAGSVEPIQISENNHASIDENESKHILKEAGGRSSLNEKRYQENLKNSTCEELIVMTSTMGTRLKEKESVEDEVGQKMHVDKNVRLSPQISSKHDKKIWWKKGKEIGRGSYGTVFLGINKESGALLAIKEVPFKRRTPLQIRELRREINFLRSFKHLNIVRYVGTEVENHSLYIFTEWVSGGSLLSVLKKFRGRLHENVVRMYSKQILTGLVYLHKHGVLHRDIKPANILVDDRGNVKLADFGASKKWEKHGGERGGKNFGSSLVGTPYYMAPEVLSEGVEDIGFASDIWSVSGTVLELLTGSPPWKSMNFKNLAALMYHLGSTTEPPVIPGSVGDDATLFLQSCFAIDPSQRPSAKDLLNHAFILNKQIGKNVTKSM